MRNKLLIPFEGGESLALSFLRGCGILTLTREGIEGYSTTMLNHSEAILLRDWLVNMLKDK